MASILVVDDSATIRQQLRLTLEEAQHQVSEAENGAEGLELAKKRPFDLFIVDINMPVMDGIELIAKLRTLDAHAKTPIFVLTTDAAGDSLDRGRKAGATAWIVKPFKRDILIKGVEKVLK